MTLKEKLAKNELTIGTWVTIGHPAVVEILAVAGFDWITIDLEHTTIDLSTAQNLIAIIQSKGIKALVRVSKNEEVIIKRVLDAGADGVIVPMIKNEEDARQAVGFVKYPPLGNRGVGLGRAQKYGQDFEGYKERLENEIIVVAQIEHIDAIHNLEAIQAVEGIDGTLIGPYDLSASMGKPGQYHLPEVKRVIERYDEICKTNGKPMGAHVISSNSEDLQEKINLGYNFLAFSLDFFFLGNKAMEEMKKLNKVKNQ